jgi:anti-sigma B factor antagonist
MDRSMQSDFRVETETLGRVTMLTPSGELDLVSAPILDGALQRAEEPGAEIVVVDLRQLEFMDSTGLHVFVAAQQRARAAGRRFAVVRGGETVQRLFDLTGVAESFTIIDSLDELLDVEQAPGTP